MAWGVAIATHNDILSGVLSLEVDTGAKSVAR